MTQKTDRDRECALGMHKWAFSKGECDHCGISEEFFYTGKVEAVAKVDAKPKCECGAWAVKDHMHSDRCGCGYCHYCTVHKICFHCGWEKK